MWELIDAEVRAARYPKKFRLPPKAERHALVIGAFAKLIFDDRERMWVEVTNREHGGWYRGELRNDPYGLPGAYGDAVRFHARHVIEIESAEGMARRREQRRADG
jgi:hypothetical protein